MNSSILSAGAVLIAQRIQGVREVGHLAGAHRAKEGGGVPAVMQPFLLQPAREPGCSAQHFLGHVLWNVVGHRPHGVGERGIEATRRTAICDTPRTDGLVKLLLRIHRAGVGVGPTLLAAHAAHLVGDYRAGADGIGVITKLGQLLGGGGLFDRHLMILPAPCCARQRGGQTRMVGRLVHVAALIVADPHGRANGLHVSRRKRDQRGAYGVRLPLSTECGRRGVGRIGWALKGRRADKTVTRGDRVGASGSLDALPALE